MSRLAIVSEHASPIAQAGGVDSGGQNIYVAQVARRLAKLGHSVDVFTRMDNPNLPLEMEWDAGVRIVHVPAGPATELPKELLLPYMDAFSAFMHGYFSGRDEPYRLIHANFFMSAHAALPVAQRFGIPLAVTFHALGRVRRRHQAEADRFPDSRFAIEDHIVRHADCVIAECPEDRRDLLELYGADPGKIRMVSCGYDPQEMWPMDRRVARQALGWPQEGFHILQLGRMVPRKGVDNVIRGLALLRKEHGVDARLYVVGGESPTPSPVDTPELGRLMQVAEEAGVSGFVEFTGRRRRDQLRRYYGACDAFVTTPWYEPFGITPVEAMACARPVVGSDTGGIRHTVVDGKTGLLVPPRDPQALAAALARLARERGFAERLGEEGARRAARHFTWSRVGQELDQVFDELCSEPMQTLSVPLFRPVSRLPV